jgi:hypothetical protein
MKYNCFKIKNIAYLSFLSFSCFKVKNLQMMDFNEYQKYMLENPNYVNNLIKEKEKIEAHLIDIDKSNYKVQANSNFKIFDIYQNYSFIRNLKKTLSHMISIEKLLKNYLHFLTVNILKSDKKEMNNSSNKILLEKINHNEIINLLQNIENLKLNSIYIKNIDNLHFLSYLFCNYEMLILRIFSNLIILNKEGKIALNSENINFILNFCNRFIKNSNNESLILLAKRVLINYYSPIDYNYSDYILEMNQLKNLTNLINSSKDKNIDKFDYNLIFVNGLNVK